MALDRLRPESELLRDIAVAATLDNATHHFKLARGEAVGFAGRGTAACCMRLCKAVTRFTTRLPPIQQSPA